MQLSGFLPLLCMKIFLWLCFVFWFMNHCHLEIFKPILVLDFRFIQQDLEDIWYSFDHSNHELVNCSCSGYVLVCWINWVCLIVLNVQLSGFLPLLCMKIFLWLCFVFWFMNCGHLEIFKHILVLDIRFIQQDLEDIWSSFDQSNHELVNHSCSGYVLFCRINCVSLIVLT